MRPALSVGSMSSGRHKELVVDFLSAATEMSRNGSFYQQSSPSFEREDVMNTRMKHFMGLVGCGLMLMMPLKAALADSDSQEFRQLSAEWWQWALSIPVADNPLMDATGEKCMVGQSGSLWFLAGTFGGGPVTRNCAVPEDTVLFFPVINSVFIDTPNVCGQGPDRIPVKDLRAAVAPFIDGATNLLVEVDGTPTKKLHRIRSEVFAAALPEDNLFDGPCASIGSSSPAGIFSPAIDDGFYVQLKPLKVGAHTLHIHAENVSAGFTLDVTYNLMVVRTKLH